MEVLLKRFPLQPYLRSSYQTYVAGARQAACRKPFSTARVPPRVMDASRQQSVIKEPPRRRSFDEPTLVVPETTPGQKLANEAKQKADDGLVAAKALAREAETVAMVLRKVAEDYSSKKKEADAQVLKKVAEEYAAEKKEADARVQAAIKLVDEAALAKKAADEKAVDLMKDAANQEKLFLRKAFMNFDTNKVGYLTHRQVGGVLEALKLPANDSDVDELVRILNVAGDNAVRDWEWESHMPEEMRQALRNHPLASQWA